jgi:hypothetical protein
MMRKTPDMKYFRKQVEYYLASLIINAVAAFRREVVLLLDIGEHAPANPNHPQELVDVVRWVPAQRFKPHSCHSQVTGVAFTSSLSLQLIPAQVRTPQPVIPE